MYLALARKYRPQTWSSVIGQEHVTGTLALAVHTARLHHAYLFCGARGVGKTTVARILAKAVNCTARDGEGNPCNHCATCTMITDGRSLDVQEIDGASHTSVEDIRELIEQLKYLPTGVDSYKIFIIDEVHMLSRSAFNALLKTLEEPPPHILFIFATTEPHAIPVTVLSRCQRYDFRRVSRTKVVETLRGIATAEAYQISDDVLHFLAIESEGSLRDAESLLDQTVAFAGTTVTMDAVRSLLGYADQHTMRAMLQAIVTHDAGLALDTIANIFQAGGNIPRLAHDILVWVRHAWVLASCDRVPDADELAPDDVTWLRTIVAQATLPEWQQWFALLYRGYDDIARGKFPRLVLEAVVLQMIQVPQLDSVRELLERAEENAARPGASAAPAIKSPSAAPLPPAPRRDVAPTAAPAAAAPSGDWATFVSWLRSAQPRLSSIVEQARVLHADAATVQLQYPKDSIYGEMLMEADRRAQLQNLIHEHFSPTCRLHIEHASAVAPAAATVPAKTLAADPTVGMGAAKAARHAAAQQPIIQDAIRILGAEVREVKILTDAGS